MDNWIPSSKLAKITPLSIIQDLEGGRQCGNVFQARNDWAKAFDERGIRVLGAHKGYTRTHQVILDVREFGGGFEAAQRLAKANIITNKNLIPGDKPEDWDYPSGLRIGTIEVTRYGMKEPEISNCAARSRRSNTAIKCRRWAVERGIASGWH